MRKVFNIFLEKYPKFGHPPHQNAFFSPPPPSVFFSRDNFFCARDTARKNLPVTLLHTRDKTVKCYP